MAGIMVENTMMGKMRDAQIRISREPLVDMLEWDVIDLHESGRWQVRRGQAALIWLV